MRSATQHEGSWLMAERVVAVLGTLDTKGAEYVFLKERIEEQGVRTLVIDAGVLSPPPFRPEVSAAEVAKAGGAELAKLVAENDRGNAVAVMSRGVAQIVKKLHADGRIHGIIAMGGGGGTMIGSTAMQALPIGLPKLLLSTLASGGRR
jgi:uncharacterized protein (UPF0261 family)